MVYRKEQIKILSLLRTEEMSLNKKLIQHILDNYESSFKAVYKDILSEIEQQLLQIDLMEKKIVSQVCMIYADN